LSDAKLALESFINAVPEVKSRPAPTPVHIERKLPSTPNNPLTALEAFDALSELRSDDAIVVNETASNFADFLQCWPIQDPIRTTPCQWWARIEVCIGEPGARAIALLERAFEVATISVLEPFAGAMAA
jgi:hypothetical protein